MPHLIFYVEQGFPESSTIRSGKTVIGKSEHDDLIISEPSVAASHAELNRQADGSCSIKNLNPENNLSVNGKVVDDSVRLKDGDRIIFGSVKALFCSSQNGSAPEKPQGLKSIINKEEAGRNNLRLLESDSKWMRDEIEKSLDKKEALEAELDSITKKVVSARIELDGLDKEMENLESIKSETKTIQEKFDKLTVDHESRQSELDKVEAKIEATEKSLQELDLEAARSEKEQLSADISRLNEEIDTAKKELEEIRSAANEAETVYEKAKQFEEELSSLEAKLAERKSELEDLERKIADGEKRIVELDLDNTVAKKEALTAELEELSRELDRSRDELDKNRRASTEASAIFEEAKTIEAGISEMEATLAARKSDCETVEQSISAREKTVGELETKISESNSALENLAQLLMARKGEVEKLTQTVAENEEQIRTAGGRLAEVEERIQAAVTEIAKSQQKHETLEEQSLSLTRIVSSKSAILKRLKSRISSGGAGALCPPLRFVNPQMGSLMQYFHHGAASPGAERIEPVGLPAFAACTKGSMHRDADSIMSEGDPVLLRLSGSLEKDSQLIGSISPGSPQRVVLACWDPGKFQALVDEAGEGISQLLDGVSGIVSFDPGTAKSIEDSNLDISHINLPIPSPVDSPEWDLSIPVSDRNRGLFLCGDGYDSGSELHRSRLELVNQLVAATGTTVTLFQSEKVPIKGLTIPEKLLETCVGPLAFSEYLRLAGNHFLVTGFGDNFAGGEVTGDAVLARCLFLGADANNATAELLFADLCVNGSDFSTALESASGMLSDSAKLHEAVENSGDLAFQIVSFDSVSERIGEFITS
ncbi:MAG: FHA domain-containing protein [Verrucomicrobiales bacterium]|nr:FHA domain-containing protein [Verrucomicrobiales bacterium]